MRAIVFVLLAMVGTVSWAVVHPLPAGEHTLIVHIGPGETLELAWFLVQVPPDEDETEEEDCKVEFDVTFSEQSVLDGEGATKTVPISLSVEEPLAEAKFEVPGLGKLVLVNRKARVKRGPCMVLSTGRVATGDGLTITGGNFQIHPPNIGW